MHVVASEGDAVQQMVARGGGQRADRRVSHGVAEILERGEERDRAESMLRDKYPQYDSFLDPGCMVC